MPKLKKTPLEAQMEIVSANILSRGAYFGCKTDADFAKRICISKTTFRERRVSPRSWRLDELVRAADTFKCSLVWLMTDHGVQE